MSQQELDQSVAQLAQAEAQLLIRNAAVETAKVDLSRCIITAPIDGVVLDRPATAGKTVSASTSAPVLFVLVNDLSLLQIKAAIAEADIGNVKEGQTANFTVDAFPGQAFKGTVRQIRNQPVVQSNVVTYATLIDVRNDSLTLKPGMTANVSVNVQERVNALMLANSALRTRIPDELKLPALPALGCARRPRPGHRSVPRSSGRDWLQGNRWQPPHPRTDRARPRPRRRARHHPARTRAPTPCRSHAQRRIHPDRLSASDPKRGPARPTGRSAAGHQRRPEY